MESKDFIHHETAATGINSAATPTTFSAGAAVASHPLQDVDLSLDAEPEIASTKTVNKNWVKFDDEANGDNDDVDFVGSAASGVRGVAAINENHNNKGSEGISATLATPKATTATAATTLNKLSPPPPTQSRRSTSPATTTTTTGAPHTQPEKTMNKHSAAVAPVQRQTISSSTTVEAEIAPAVLTTESTHVNLNASGKTQQQHQQQQQHLQQPHKPKASATNQVLGNNNNNSSNAGHVALGHHNNNGNNAGGATSSGVGSGNKAYGVTIPVETAPPMRTIELSTGRIREGFANGDVIVTLLPANTKWPWITPAIFRPELVPEELMAQGLTLTVEEYVHAMETLVNDYRFTVYNICYKRILVCWILFAFAVLLTLLFSGLQGVALFSLGVGWLFLNAAAIFLCMWVKLRLSRGLEKCLARVNKQLMRHKILLILDDRGRISCHKVNLCFLYFDATQCITYLNEFLEHTEQNGGEAIKAGWEAKLDIDVNDIVIQGNNPVRLSRKQVVAQELFLSYLQRWGKDFLRRRLDWTVQEAGVHETPRHLQSSICPCQYEEEVLRNKIKTHLQPNHCCGINCLGCWL